MATIKRPKFDSLISFTQLRSIQILTALLFLYLILVVFEIPLVFKSEIPILSSPLPNINHNKLTQNNFKTISGLVFDDNADAFSQLHVVARDAFVLGKKVLNDLESGKLNKQVEEDSSFRRKDEDTCPNSVVLSENESVKNNMMMVIPCGLTLGSHITVVGRPRKDNESGIEFVMELQGLQAVDGEAPPKILHFNPRLKGDWSRRPVIEQNTCYRMQWGSAQRCVGWRTKADEETVDGQVKCEKWIHGDDSGSEESNTRWWLKRLIGRTKKVTVDWPYPFAENKLFVLTLIAGLEGFHVNVDGRHVSSFSYRPGFVLEDATGLFLDGDVDVHSVVAASLPTTHPSNAPRKHLEFSAEWKAPNIQTRPVELFIGILSAGNHFAERMAVRKSWLQYSPVKSSTVVARFFVAMHARNEVNVELMKEAEYFGDIVMVPYMDNYDLVVLKTVAICEYGVRMLAAKYIMKCDDDTFVRIDAVMMEVKKILNGRSFYIGNINYYHKPLRHGKWAVTYEEWPEEAYPPYANGPGYVVSSDIAKYIVSDFEKHKLRLFKMEDVSMGTWVEQFNRSRSVEYVHSYKFCQFGCVEGYYTAHYQSPKQITCLWAHSRCFKRKFTLKMLCCVVDEQDLWGRNLKALRGMGIKRYE